MPKNVFRFEVESRYRLPLLVYGVTKGRAEVTVDEEDVHIRFGPWSTVTPLANISRVEVTGPYRWWRVIGLRMSLVDRGITFGTATGSGVCMELNEPISVRIGPFTVPLHHPGVTVTTEDPSGLAGRLEPGQDTA